MAKTIYYFTGTGNSLAVAKDTANLTMAKLLSIPSLIDKEEIEVDSEIIGIVFPVYHQNLPNIVRKFILKLTNLKDKYIFAICTYGDSPAITLNYLQELLKEKEGKLGAGFSIKMPYNYINPSLNIFNFFNTFTLRNQNEQAMNKMFNQWEDRAKYIADIINNTKETEIETEAVLIEKLVDLLNLRNTLQKYIWLKVAGYNEYKGLTFNEAIKFLDYGFEVDDSCNVCEICAKICPVNNIAIKKGKPDWQHNCEQCFTCLQWCPQHAIQFKEGTKNKERYHHPEITLSEIIDNKYSKGAD